nr:DUF1329 domain-containing protein [Bacteroidota bacterium]
MKNMRTQYMVLSFMAAFVVFLTLFSETLSAEEVQYPVSAYSAKELAKVREWEKTWSGKTIDTKNVNQVSEYLPESYVDIYKNPEKWGAPPGENITAIILPYNQIIETKGMIEATKKYAPLVKTHPDGSIANYGDIAGIPYPHPKTGLEIAWNVDFNNHGDTEHFMRDGPNINPKQRTERTSKQEQWYLTFMHRTEIDPKPVLSTKKGILRGTFVHMYEPPEFINTRYYNLRFVDSAKDDVTYFWYAQFRRIRRLSTTHRTDSIDGTDLCYDDEFFWDGHIQRNTYEYKGKKDLLCCRHQDTSKFNRPNGQIMSNDLMLERLNTLVVDVISKDPNYLYSKRVWYVDPETYIILWTEIYDQKGRFWKCFMQNTGNNQTAKGETKNNIMGSVFVDYQRIHGGHSTSEMKGVSVELDTNMFSITNLQRTY